MPKYKRRAFRQLAMEKVESPRFKHGVVAPSFPPFANTSPGKNERILKQMQVVSTPIFQGHLVGLLGLGIPPAASNVGTVSPMSVQVNPRNICPGV